MASSISTPEESVPEAIRVVSPGHLAFAIAMIALGVIGFVTGDFTQVWLRLPNLFYEKPLGAWVVADSYRVWGHPHR